MVLLAALLVGAGLGLAAFGIWRTRQFVAAAPSPVEVALGEAEPREPGGVAPGLAYRALEPIFSTGARIIRRLSPAARIDLIRRRIVYAGMEGRITSDQVLAYKAILAVVGFLLGLGTAPGRIPTWVWAPALGFLASFIPDLILDARARARQEAIARDLSEALDLLAITVEAGLGLEQAIEIVVENIRGPLEEELRRLLREVELGVSRRQALTAFRERTDIPELSAFIVALIQADQMGVAIAEVLKIQASQVRLKRRQRARERGAQTPVKILFPVIFGIFPAIFVVTIGPGAIKIFEAIIR